MLQFDSAAIREWIVANQPGAPISPVGEIAMDDLPTVRVALERLAVALDRAAQRYLRGLADVLDASTIMIGMQTALGHLSPARRLRLLSWLQAEDAGVCLRRLWADTPGNLSVNPGEIIRKSLQHLHRAACANRLFAHDRISHLLFLCEGDSR